MNYTKSNSYEKKIIDIMIEEGVTLSQAMEIDFYSEGVDAESVFDIVDYLEYNLKNLDFVEYYMLVYTQQLPDLILKKVE